MGPDLYLRFPEEIVNCYCAGIRLPETESKFSDAGISRSVNEARFSVQAGDFFFAFHFYNVHGIVLTL